MRTNDRACVALRRSRPQTSWALAVLAAGLPFPETSAAVMRNGAPRRFQASNGERSLEYSHSKPYAQAVKVLAFRVVCLSDVSCHADPGDH